MEEKKRVPFRLTPSVKEKFMKKIETIPGVNSIQQRLETLVLNDINSATTLESISRDITEIKLLLQKLTNELELK